MELKGIDVSAWQGIIDWNKVKASGIQFAILRAGTGRNNLDKTFNQNAAECNRLGIPIGVYWFSYALNEAMAKAEAEYCVNIAKKYKLTYPVYFDLEYDSVSYGAKNGVTINKTVASKFARAFLNRVKELGYTPGLYTNGDYANRMFEPDLLSNYHVWFATYGPAKCPRPDIAKIWQYSSKGKVSGINGNVDMNICYYPYTNEISAQPSPVQQPNNITSSVISLGIPDINYSSVFDADYYYNKYPDLQKAFGKNDKKLLEHFKTFGMNEQRQASANFNIKVYKTYPDLAMAFGENMPLYYAHYCIYGKNEKRKAV